MADDTTDSGPPPIAGPHVFRLMNLPNEIIGQIVNDDELRIKDLKTLRLTNKRICELTSDTFAQKCFCDITVLMTRSSLRALIELSQHPHFGPKVSWINISPKSILPSPFCMSMTYERLKDIDKYQSKHSIETLQVMRTFLNRSTEECELKGDRSAERMLSIAFKVFATRDQCINLQIADDEFAAIGAREFAHAEASGEHVTWRLDWKSAFEKTFRAVSNSGCKVSALCISDTTQGHPMAASGLCINAIEYQLSATCSQLTHLEIRFPHGNVVSTINSVKRMVSAARNLEYLYLYEISHASPTRRNFPREVLKSVVSSSLEEIILCDLRIPERELVEFIGKYSNTLESLKIWDMCLLTGSCMSLIAWIKDNLPSLVCLNLFNFCEHNDPIICKDRHVYEEHAIDRDEDMQTCLADILNGKRKPTSIWEVRSQI